MKRLMTLFILTAAAASASYAGTLYRWADAAGTIRFGYQPPPGVPAEPVEEERREVKENLLPMRCADLARDHLQVLDRELVRIEGIEAGLGPGYELTPALKQQLVLDLLAHRAAMITGRSAAEFKSPGTTEIEQLKARMEREKQTLEKTLKDRDEQIDQQQSQLQRAEKEKLLVRHPPYVQPSALLPGR